MADRIPAYDKTVLTDGRISLRAYRKKNVAECVKAIQESEKEMSPWMPWLSLDAHYDLKQGREWVKMCARGWKNGTQYNFVIVDVKDDTLLGCCGLNDINKESLHANLGYWVRTSRTGQGIAPAATRLLAAWGFKTLGLKRIEVVVAVENARSLGAAARAGAKREGVLRNRINIRGKMLDAVMHSLIPEDFGTK